MAALSVAEATRSSLFRSLAAPNCSHSWLFALPDRFGSASWIQFNSDMKAWAYAEDQKCTTHSVNPESVVDTQGAFANFDGVTYGKGASVLKQLVALIGMDNFKAGMQLYFKKCVPTEAHARSRVPKLSVRFV